MFYKIRQNVSVETFTMLPFDISLFNELARHFLTVSNAVGDDWFIEKYDNSNSVELILRKRVTICRENINDSDQVNDSDESDELQLEDDVLGDERGTDIVTWDYQIIFSESFCSPVLYFNASDANGRTLSLDSLCIETKSNFGVITQQMHPIFNFPFYYVHPCDMATNTGWFRLAQETATNALVTWLSTVASVVKLTVLEDYSHFKFDYRNILENFKE